MTRIAELRGFDFEAFLVFVSANSKKWDMFKHAEVLGHRVIVTFSNDFGQTCARVSCPFCNHSDSSVDHHFGKDHATQLSLGKLRVHLIKMHPDLVPAEEMEKIQQATNPTNGETEEGTNEQG